MTKNSPFESAVLTDRLGARLEPNEHAPLPLERIPPDFLVDAEHKLKNYPNLFKRYTKAELGKSLAYFADYMSGSACLDRANGKFVFLLEERYGEVAANARGLLVFLHLVGRIAELGLNEPNDTLSADFNRRVVAFFVQAIAYYRLTANEKRLIRMTAKALDDLEPQLADRLSPNIGCFRLSHKTGVVSR